MDYFWIKQDQRYTNTPLIEGFYSKMRRKDFTIENAHRIPERNVVYCDTNKPLYFADILDSQLFLISETVKYVFHMYERDISYKLFCMLNNITGDYSVYYAPIFPTVDCLISRRSFGTDELKLRGSALGPSSIFRVKDESMEIVVIRLDVVESLLRRKISGMVFMRAVIN